jgi:peptidoglycan L-alanyl-D-glutamate endopeptidase CwlK
MTARDTARLAGVHPVLVDKTTRILLAMAALGFEMGVTDGVRTLAQQQAAWAEGRTFANGIWTLTGPTVTNCDGIIHPSNHQVKADGFGHAVDCAFIIDINADGIVELDEPFTWDGKRPWLLYGTMAEALGLTWGGRWTSPHDLPHIELP